MKYQELFSNRDEPGRIVSSTTILPSRGQERVFIAGVGTSIADLGVTRLFTEAILSDNSFKIPLPVFPVRFSELAIKDNVVIPKLGEHNQEICDNLCSRNS